MPNPQISIVIPAFNAEKTIAKTLEAVLALEFTGEKEIIVVDDGSSDRTAQIVQKYSQIKYIRQDNAGPAKARNRGVQESLAELIFFTDSDCMPHADWLEKMLPYFQEDSKVAVVAGSYGIANKDSLIAWCVYKEICFRHEHLMPRYPKAFGSYNFGIRKNIFAQVGGFDVGYRHASGEDNDLSYKILAAGNKILFEKEALVDHYHPSSLFKYLREQYRHGFWRVKMYLDHPSMSQGDDYTFWKDALEVLLALSFFLGMVLGVFLKSFLFVAFFSFSMLLILEIIFGVLIIQNFPATPALSLTMFLRSFSRTFGFIAGCLKFVPQKYRKSS